MNPLWDSCVMGSVVVIYLYKSAFNAMSLFWDPREKNENLKMFGEKNHNI